MLPRDMIVDTWLRTEPNDRRRSASKSGVLMSTAITTSAPISRTTSTGMLATMPPSTSSRPSSSTGENAPGIDMLARIAVTRSPRAMTTFSPVTMSAATTRRGIGRRSKSSTSDAPSVRLRSSKSRFCP